MNGDEYMVAASSRDADGAPWVSLLFGKPGFVRALEGAAIVVGMPHKERDLADPVWENMEVGVDLGLLFIDPAARRSYAVSGVVQRLDRRGAEVAVRSAWPERPAQASGRVLRRLGEPRLPVQTAHGTMLRGAVERIVVRADTLFMASPHAGRGAAARHCCGAPGFVTLAGPTTLRLPAHSEAAATTGSDPRAGICIPDFAHGQVLQLTGHARKRFLGSAREWEFEVACWILRDMPRDLAWDAPDAAPPDQA